jgi:lantibiotic leader peptide-processing serine protease
MRRSRVVAFTGAVALATTAFGASTATAALQSPTASSVSSASASAASSTAGSGTYVVLVDSGADAHAVAAALRKGGATVTSVNTDIGLISVRSTSAAFLRTARGLSGVKAAANDGVVGRAPDAAPAADKVLKEHQASRNRSSGSGHGGKKAPKADPLDSLLWGMDMIHAPEAHAITLGNKKVKVGVMDTGVDGNHPDLAPNFDRKLSRNFVTDMVDIDGPCEHPGCVDPVDEDDDGHGTHTAGTMAAALNGIGLSGVAPNVSLVNVRAGQDSGYFFLSATANALTYSGNAGLDVVNMSFYVDPWLYNCKGGAPQDTPAQAAEQDVIIETMNRALNFAHRKGVTLVAALGNNNEDISHPRTDTTSPDYPGGTEHPRTIDNANCLDLPVEGPHVIGVSSLGPSERKADYSNWATDLTSGELEVSAPGGWFRDGFGTPTYRTNGNLILSTAPLNVLQAGGAVDANGNPTPAVDANGNITPDGARAGVTKDCGTVKGKAVCGYYQYLQGTSMASPHAAGVAALAVSARGHSQGRSGFGLAPDRVRALVMGTATDHACPTPPLQSYAEVGRPATYDALCTGTADFNSFYGDGIVNALGVVAGRNHGGHR